MLTLDNLSILTWTTFVQAGGLDQPATLKFVEVTTFDIEQPLFPTSWTHSLGDLCTVRGPQIDVVLKYTRQP